MHLYRDSGNSFVTRYVPSDCGRLLDVGCGSGDTSRLIKARSPGIWIEGLTVNPAEAAFAATVLDRVHTIDLETSALPEWDAQFDCLLFSHVLEHLRDPAETIRRFLPFLTPGGTMIAAVPNVLEWRTRMRFLLGQWDYADAGILDRTHLRFFTFASMEAELLGPTLRAHLQVVAKAGEGTTPLGPLRRLPFARPATRLVDELGVKLRPNLFAQQIVLVARKTP